MSSDSENDWKQRLRRYGYYAVHLTVGGTNTPTLLELREWMQTDTPKHTGWPPFWWPTRPEIAPQAVDQETYECVHDGTGPTRAIERWRAGTNGEFTVIRPHDLDDTDPGTYLSLVLPVWRIAELVLYGGRMSGRFGAPTLDVTVKFTGLNGRILTTKNTPDRMVSGNYRTEAPQYEMRLSVDSHDLNITVVNVTHRLLSGLYQLFQFDLTESFCEAEISRMRSHRF